MALRRLARALAAALPATALAAALPSAAAGFHVNPVVGPTVNVGSRNVPNLALLAAPKNADAKREESHEGEAYWRAWREDRARNAEVELPPDLNRLIAKAFHEKRVAEREKGPHPLANAGWRSLGPTNYSGRVVQYKFTPDGSKLYAATANGGVWLLTRQGGPGSDYGNPRSLTDDFPLLSFGSIGIAPSNPNVVYLATGEQSPSSGDIVDGLGTLRSTDGGQTWSFNTISVTGGATEHVPGFYSFDLNVNPNDPNDVLLGAETGIFRSRDGGQHWVNALAAQNYTRYGEGFLRRPDNPQVVWSALEGGLAYSENGGDSWTVIFEDIAKQMNYAGTAIRTAIAWTGTNGNRMYWFVAGTPNAGSHDQIGVFRSDDGGNNWVTACGPPGTQGACPAIAGKQGWAALSIAADPVNPDVVFTGGLDVWRSGDAGVTWTQVSEWTLPEHHPQYCHADIRTLTFENGLANLWVGSDGGLFRSIDSGKTYLWKNDGVVARMFSSIAQHPTDPYTLFAGTQDNGTQKLSGNSTTAWRMVHGGDGYDCAVRPDDPNVVYATYYNGYTTRASDGGQSNDSFKDITCPDSAQSNSDCPLQAVTSFRSRLVMYPSNPNILLTMTNTIFYTTNGGVDAQGNPDPSDWKRIYSGYFCRDGYHDEADCPNLSPAQYYAQCRSIGLNPKDTNRVALGTRSDYLLYTLDDFSHSTIYRDLPQQQNTIVWDPDDPNAFWVGLESSVNGHTLYHVSGLNTSSPTATPKDNGISVPITYQGATIDWYAPVDCLAISPDDSRLMFAGTKYGIFRSTDGGASWSYFGDEFPATWVSALLFTPDGSLLRAATWGRGMWEINPRGGSVTSANPPTPAFHFDPESPRPGQTVSFTDDSTGGASSWSWSFGDGTGSSTQSPDHVFAVPGTYNVMLTVSNSAGSRSTARAVVVTYGSTGTGGVFTYLLPVVVASSGENGALFTTEVSFTNRAGRPLSLTFRAKGSGFESASSYALAAGQEIHGDVIAFLKSTGMSLPSGNVVASLRIEVSGADDLSQFGALARVTTPPNASLFAQSIRGRFGLAFPAMPLGRGAVDDAVVYGLQDTSEPGTAGTRSNLACVSAGSNGTLQLEATYHDGDTGADASGPDTFTLSPFQFDQRNRPLKARGIRHGYVRIRRVSGTDQFVCYAVLNDNLNGDGAFVPMVVNDEPSPTPSAIVPVIVDTAGFRSEMTVANRTQRNIAALFAVIRADDPVPDWGYYNFDPGEQTTIADIAQDLRDAGFELPSGSVASIYLEFLDGTLRDDQSDTQIPIPTSEGYVGVRTYQERAGGLFGLAYGYAPLGTAADTQAFVYGLQQTGVKGVSAGTRSNLAVVHALGGSVEPLTLEVTYYGPNGAVLGTEPPLTLQPGEWHQFNAPLARFGVPHGFARVRRISGSDQFLAYGVLNDQLNDDGSYVPMIVP